MALNIKTALGVAIASVKTFEGVTNANTKTWDGVDNTSGGVTYATWNPSDKDSSSVLSGGNLTNTSTSGSGYGCVRATIGKSSGKWYFEVIYQAGTSYDIGLATASADLTLQLGGDVNGWAEQKIPGFTLIKRFHSNSAVNTGFSGVAINDVIGIAFDCGAGTMDLYWNNTNVYTFTGLSGTLYPACSSGNFNNSFSGTANFGATALTYSPPAGYNAGVF